MSFSRRKSAPTTAVSIRSRLLIMLLALSVLGACRARPATTPAVITQRPHLYATAEQPTAQPRKRSALPEAEGTEGQDDERDEDTTHLDHDRETLAAAAEDATPDNAPKPPTPAHGGPLQGIFDLLRRPTKAADASPESLHTWANDYWSRRSVAYDPQRDWDDNIQRLYRHFRDFRRDLTSVDGASTADYWQRHDRRRELYESALPEAWRNALPGRGAPQGAPEERQWLLRWDTQNYDGQYETVIRATGPAGDDGTPVEVITYERRDDRVEARYPARAFVDQDGVVQIDAVGQRVESDHLWSPDSFTLLPDGGLRTIDDKFAGSGGQWTSGGDG